MTTRVVMLAAGRSLSVAQVDAMVRALQAAAGAQVEIDLFSWSPVEQGARVRSATVLGPVSLYTPPAAAAPGSTPDSAPGPQPLPSRTADPGSAPAGQGVRRVAGRLVRAVGWRLRRARRGPTYQRLRRAVRGDVPRRFAASARKDPTVAAAFRDADVVVTLDANAVPAAWRVGRRVPGPAVVQGLPAAERELRAVASAPAAGSAAAQA